MWAEFWDFPLHKNSSTIQIELYIHNKLVYITKTIKAHRRD